MTTDAALCAQRKANFTDIYHQPDPRDYVATLGDLDYQVTQLAAPTITSVLEASGSVGQPRTVLDVCCSYGINGALLRHGVSLEETRARYDEPEMAELGPADLIAADRDFYDRQLLRPDLTFLGLDISEPAIDYATQAGLHVGGWAENLETDDPSTALAAGLSDVDLVVCTGGVGYIGPDTFGRILDAVEAPEKTWLVVFVLRVFSYDAVADKLATYGLVTEQVPGRTIRQRRFADQDEYEAANHDVRQRGLDPTGLEATGWYYADCFLSRPAAQAAATPVQQVLPAA